MDPLAMATSLGNRVMEASETPTQVGVGIPEGLKHDSAIQCDGLVSLEKTRLTDYVGELSSDKLGELEHALSLALALRRSAPSI